MLCTGQQLFCLWCLLVLGILQCVTPSATLTADRGIYFHDKTLDDMISTGNVSWLEADTVLQCARRCHNQAWCNSFFHHVVSRNCSLQRMVFVLPSPSEIMAADGWRYYRITSVRYTWSSQYVTDRLTATSYRLLTSPYRQWKDGEEACRDNQETLAVLDKADKAQFLLDFIRANTGVHGNVRGFNIGARRALSAWNTTLPADGNPNLEWINGHPMDLNATRSFWREGEMKWGPGRNVVVMKVNYHFLWGDGRDHNWRNTVCERPYSS